MSVQKPSGAELWARWLLTPDWRAQDIEAELRRRLAAAHKGGLFEGRESAVLEELLTKGRRP